MIAIVMGSKSDWDVVEQAVKVLGQFGVPFTVRVLSAHRTPDKVREFVGEAQQEGTKVFICAAGKAAHLGGVVASYTVLPVVGIPIKTSDLGGVDSLYSTVQMPSGIPVATVAINGAENAALLAIQMLAIGDSDLSEKLKKHRAEMIDAVIEQDEDVQNLIIGMRNS